MFRSLLLVALFLSTSLMFGQSVIGTWKTIDDETGKAKSHVKVYIGSDGKLHGKVVKILDESKKDKTCTKCKGSKKDEKILGMEILWGLEKDGKKKYDGGTILDPNKGEEYSCKIQLVSNDKLKVRGFLGVSMIGRTQYWYRVD